MREIVNRIILSSNPDEIIESLDENQREEILPMLKELAKDKESGIVYVLLHERIESGKWREEPWVD